ncbi:MAG: sulfite exporter TauE/SafE family protein [Theionarchaea archaeon]|nr:sulfite exporter TauE/SafE family protein [Theionarchaea archaeon]
MEGIDQIPVVTAFILGLVTAVSPCTLATNISGAAFVSRTMTTPRYAVLVGVLLSTGRTITFVIIGGIMIFAGQTIGEIALLSQTVGSILLGCVLIIVGILFLNIIQVNLDIGGGVIAKMVARTHTMGLLGALFLGVLFGLAFCPYSAALFFGMLIPLAVGVSEGYFLPIFFGLGVNVPILVFTGMISFGMGRARSVMQKVAHTWTVISGVLGAVLISIGVFYVAPYFSKSPLIQWLPYVVGAVVVVFVILREVKKNEKK